jgi:2,3-bisphosphoglycerate-independent phosphoglycerate mutase
MNRDVTQREANAFCDLLNAEVSSKVGFRCRFESYSTYRLAIELEIGEPASDAITGTDPGYASDEFATLRAEHDFAPVQSRPLVDTHAGRRSSDAVNDVAAACAAVLGESELNRSRILVQRLPANYVLMRDFGVGLAPIVPFSERWGVRAKYFHDLPVEVGVAHYLGMDEEKAGCADVSIDAFADAASRVVRDLDEYGFICFHVKGPDEPGHDGDWKRKVAALETVDEGLFRPLLRAVPRLGDRVAVTSDHATCWSLGTHTGDPVPVVVAESHLRSPGLRLTERHGRDGSLGISRGWDLMPLLLRGEQRAETAH